MHVCVRVFMETHKDICIHTYVGEREQSIFVCSILFSQLQKLQINIIYNISSERLREEKEGKIDGDNQIAFLCLKHLN